MTIIHANAVEWANAYDGPLFHALLCDPPYHLTEITKRFGKAGAAAAQHGTDGAFQRASRGFMGRDWDGGDLAFRPETWVAFGRVLHAGAFGMAFASTRGFHRMAVAIEDAGFIIHPVIMAFTFGTGFPKATRIKYETCQCARGSAQTKHDLSGMQQADLQATESDSGTNGSDLLYSVQKQSLPQQGAEAGLWDEGRKKSRMEGRSNLPQVTRQLCISTVCEMPDLLAADGPQGWVRNGASASDGSSVRLSAYSNGSSTPRRSQPTEQPAEQLGAMAGQSQPQDVGTRQHCDRCGLPFVNPFEGHRYGGQALKPALEPIIVFQKPYQGRPVDCITRTGAGAINIDAGRIGSGGQLTWSQPRDMGYHGGSDNGSAEALESTLGRWPANLILSHHPACNGHCVQDCPVQRLGEQSGESNDSHKPGTQYHSDAYTAGDGWGNIGKGQTGVLHGDSGTAARYFYNADWMAERLEDSDPVLYQAKASTAEREAGLEAFESITIDDGREKSIDNAYQRGETSRKNPHPTIKPIALARHLATLLLPPAEYSPRRLFVPFAGVASEMIGAMLAGWEDVQGVELEADHIPIARARLDYWQQRKWELMNPAAAITVKAAAKVPAGQADMFDEAA